MRRPAAALIAVALALLAAACSTASAPTATPASGTPAVAATPPAPATPAASVTPVAFARTQIGVTTPAGARTINVEVAATPAQSERGLGYRDALPADAGMLFDLGATRTQQFWMKGMRFALDFVWIGADQRVAGVTPDVPPQPGAADADLRLYAPPSPVRYVLEVNAGAAARLGIAAGTQLSFTLP